MSPTDPGLDERVCRKLGWPPHDDQGGPDWPPISTSWEWAGRAMEELCAKNKWCMISGPHHDGQPWWQCAIHANQSGPIILGRRADTGPMAVAVAIDAALPEVKG